MKLRLLLTISSFLFAFHAFSQGENLVRMMTLPNGYGSLYELQHSDSIPVNRIYLPLVFDGKVLPDSLGLYRKYVPVVYEQLQLSVDDRWLQNQIYADSLGQAVMRQAAVTDPYLVRYRVNKMPKKEDLEKIEKEAAKGTPFADLFRPEEFKLPSTPSHIKGVKQKISYWKNFSVANVQFTQNYISDNWHQGGESNISLLATFNRRFEYRDDKNIQFDNEIDWRAGFFSTPSDTLRMFKVSEDQFRLTSKFGYKAFGKWYYTASVEFKTKLFNAYKANTREMLSSFLTPAEMYFSLGMDYKTKFDSPNIQNLSVFISPVTYNLKLAVRDEKVDVTRFGIDKGKKTVSSVGSMIRANISYPVIKNILWESRFYYYTTYSNIVSEWENSFTFILNRFFTTRIFCIVRYDDNVVLKDDNNSFFQVKEFLSIGFTYKW